MEMELIIGWIGFLLAVYSVMGNDAPAQVLGTLIASHPDRKWVLWLGSSAVLVAALVYSWVNYDGGVSFDRLHRIPETPMKWYFLLGPLGLLVLTRFGVPVSTSFMVLAMLTVGAGGLESLIAGDNSSVLNAIIIKSMIGYGLSFAVAFGLWFVLDRLVTLKGEANLTYWRPLQYLSTGTLWWFWLSHDMANIAIFLPRELSVWALIIICIVSVASLGLVFRESGGRVHKVVFKGDREMDIRSATLIDAVYAMILFFFKEWNDLPMSTTWVFVGLMGGREIGRAIWTGRTRKPFRRVFAKLGMLTLGAVVSLCLVIFVMGVK